MFKYQVLPYIEGNELHCDFTIIDCTDEEIKINATDYMNKDFAFQLRQNSQLYPLLKHIAENKMNNPIIFTLSLCYVKDISLQIEDNNIGKLIIETRINNVSTIMSLEQVIIAFVDSITTVLEQDGYYRKEVSLGQ